MPKKAYTAMPIMFLTLTTYLMFLFIFLQFQLNSLLIFPGTFITNGAV